MSIAIAFVPPELEGTEYARLSDERGSKMQALLAEFASLMHAGNPDPSRACEISDEMSEVMETYNRRIQELEKKH